MTTRRAFIYGHPIAHSISPPIHNAAFASRGLDVRYEAVEVAPAELGKWVSELRRPDVVGANITVPHKEAVLALVDEVDQDARAIGAANTIANLGGRLRASNTDAPGFGRALREAGCQVEGASIVVLGAGGSARAVVQAVLSDGARRLLVANRHLERAERLIGDFGPRFGRTELRACPLTDLSASDLAGCDLLVNTTVVGLHGDQSPLPDGQLPAAAWVVDIIYNPPRTRLLRDAQAAGLTVMNGLPMLVHQAAVAWEIWMRRPAPLDVMWAAARSALE